MFLEERTIFILWLYLPLWHVAYLPQDEWTPFEKPGHKEWAKSLGPWQCPEGNVASQLLSPATEKSQKCPLRVSSLEQWFDHSIRKINCKHSLKLLDWLTWSMGLCYVSQFNFRGCGLTEIIILSLFLSMVRYQNPWTPERRSCQTEGILYLHLEDSSSSFFWSRNIHL